MEDQAYILSFSPMAGLRNALMDDKGICASIRHGVDGLLQIDQPGDRPDRHSVIHRDDHRLPGLTPHNSFHTNLLPDHNLFLLSSEIKKGRWRDFLHGLRK